MKQKCQSLIWTCVRGLGGWHVIWCHRQFSWKSQWIGFTFSLANLRLRIDHSVPWSFYQHVSTVEDIWRESKMLTRVRWSFINGKHIQVWILLLISAIVVTLALVLISRSRQELERSDIYFNRFYTSSDYILQIFFSQGFTQWNWKFQFIYRY